MRQNNIHNIPCKGCGVIMRGVSKMRQLCGEESIHGSCKYKQKLKLMRESTQRKRDAKKAKESNGL